MHQLPLTPRELEIAKYYAAGNNHNAITGITHVMLSTAENTLWRIRTKYRAAVDPARQEAALLRAERDKLNADARALQEQFDQLEARRRTR